MSTFNAGDKVIINAKSGSIQYFLGKPPHGTLVCELTNGTEVEIVGSRESRFKPGTMICDIKHGGECGLKGQHVAYETMLLPIGQMSTVHKCKCPRDVWMYQGCQCGGI